MSARQALSQLSYEPIIDWWWTETDSNRRHYRARVAYSRLYYRPIAIELAGREGIEPSRTGFGGQSVAVTLRPMLLWRPVRESNPSLS